MTTLGVIGGTGWLAGSLLRPALADGVIAQDKLILSSRSGRSDGFEAWPAVRCVTDNGILAAQADVVMISVRPADLDAISLDLSGKPLISVMAMVSADALSRRFNTRRVIRAMPNACAEQRLSFTPWFAAADATEDDRAFVERFFAASGKIASLGNEALLDYFTGLTGSGPAFIAAFADAMIRHAVGNGVDAPTADAAVRQLFLGGSTLMAQSKENPAETVRTFLDYRGTTAAGLAAMFDAGIQESISAGLEAAWRKAAEG